MLLDSWEANVRKMNFKGDRLWMEKKSIFGAIKKWEEVMLERWKALLIYE